MTDEVWGLADLHCHPMAHLGFGGAHDGKQFFWGLPYGPLGQALPCCRGAHGLLSGFLATITESVGLGHPVYGAPSFDGWPAARTIIHQQMHVEWLYRAYCGGLRLMVASAVNNELLASEYYPDFNGPEEFWRDPDMLVAQLQGMHDLVARPECREWMTIVGSSAEARAAIADGKLAIVLGIEIDSLGGNGTWRDDGDGDPAEVDKVLTYLIDEWNVRLLTPIHLADNGYGGWPPQQSS